MDNISTGYKIFEFRRRIFVRRDVTKAVIYCTRPVGRLVGEFDIAKILEDAPEALWMSTASGSGITKEYFDTYFDGRAKAFALQIENFRLYDEPVRPGDWFDNFTPPQSYMYIPSDITERRFNQ